MEAMPETITVEGIEADDAMAIDAVRSRGDTIICSRDKDLRQVPGLLYSWELGRQPAFGPAPIDTIGTLQLTREKGKPAKLTGTGYKWFCAQLLIGDAVDNFGGAYRCGPVAAFDLLNEPTTAPGLLEKVVEEYKKRHPDNWEAMLLEQGQLAWIVRRYNENGTPQLWRMDLYE